MKTSKILALSLVTVLVFAACGQAGGGGATPAAPAPGAAAPAAPAGETAHLNLMFWDGVMEDATRAMIADFTSQHPYITMDFSVIPWADYWLNLQTGLPAGAGPDLFWMNHPNSVTYTPSGLLMPLDGFNLDLSGFDRMQYQPFIHEGRLYGLPMFFDTIALFYNRALFDEAGVPHPPRRGWTWAEALEAAIQLTVIQGGEVMQYGLGLSHGTQTVTAPLIFSHGGHLFSADRMTMELNNSGALAGLQFLHDAMRVHRVSPTPVENATMNVGGALFVNRMMAMEVHGMWRAATYFEAIGDDLGITHLPSSTREANIYHNIAYVVGAHTAYPEAVAAFLRYATTAAHGDIVAPVFLPSHNDSQHNWFANFPTLDLAIFAEAMEIAEPLPVAGANAGAIWEVLQQEMERAIMETDQFTSEILQDISDTVNALINQS